jgi:hypothetical protein
MADYIDAFKQGLGAAEAADRARKEIDAVFEELDMQLKKATGKKISIDRKEYEKPKSFQEAISINIFAKTKETYWAIVALNPSVAKSPVKQLAIWSMDRAGYPCKIVWSGDDHTCEDKEALENSLAELLRDPLVGEILHTLMQLEDNTPEEGPAQQDSTVDR